MDMTLSVEHSAVRALAAEFVDREVLPRAAEWDRAESVDVGSVRSAAMDTSTNTRSARTRATPG